MKVADDEFSASNDSDDTNVAISDDPTEGNDAGNGASHRRWILVSTILILSTFLQSIKPSDAYAAFYFNIARNLSKQEINASLYPFRTYAMLAGLLPITFLAECVCGYIPVIVFGLLCRLVSQFLIYYGPGLGSLQAACAIFGLSHATKFIYSAFTYRMVPVHVFHRITGYIRGGNLVAHVVGGLFGQLIYTRNPPRRLGSSFPLWTDPFFLQFTVSQIAVSFGVLLFFAAIGVHRRHGCGDDDDDSRRLRPSLSLTRLRELLRSVYATREMVLFSIWWCVSFGTVDLVWDYQTTLFLDMKQTMNHTGLVISATRLGCATSAMLVGRSRSLLKVHGLGITSAGTVVIGGGLLVSALTYDLAVSYLAFVGLMMVNEFCLCSAMAEIAVATPDCLRGVALLSNTLFAMILQALLQFVCGELVLNVPIRTKYMTWSAIMGLLSVVMLVAKLVSRRKDTCHATTA
ncbi:Major facilitator superfamily (MFS) profile domain-containing protein [Plasmodiophora brassicae]|uniref:Major facilitator superfamily (MFS) profile domain-containing protein n=1 Tax=Plasmodiophora brassicae TaxID=37360 RepID=A0A3P3Y337_PLABS|nr:unnamed protein product [Plasmodiophora brassicae]